MDWIRLCTSTTFRLWGFKGRVAKFCFSFHTMTHVDACNFHGVAKAGNVRMVVI
jgi:hypothetical protein